MPFLNNKGIRNKLHLFSLSKLRFFHFKIYSVEQGTQGRCFYLSKSIDILLLKVKSAVLYNYSNKYSYIKSYSSSTLKNIHKPQLMHVPQKCPLKTLFFFFSPIKANGNIQCSLDLKKSGQQSIMFLSKWVITNFSASVRIKNCFKWAACGQRHKKLNVHGRKLYALLEMSVTVLTLTVC